MTVSIQLSADLGLKEAETTLKRVHHAVRTDPSIDASRLQGEAVRAHDAVLDNVNKLKYVFVPEHLSRYVDADALFGEAVAVKFPSAAEDIRQAGNCVAVEAGTAAVFHLMRAAERGLRTLGRKLGVALTHKGNPHRIEYADWEKVIGGIRTKIAALRTLGPGPVKQRNIECYSDVAEQCEYIRDTWRNTISHARRDYNTQEAIAIMQRVEGFMLRLARDLRRMK